ncbi:MAG: 23S rRNA pseudouridine2604 synthase [Thiomicrorhabdus sp.]|nr:MAG: 23S rRNA pseudouridine2604 synthase [Thiomicrorhabdus sp.]
MNISNEKRLNKFISDSGFCSRREADRLVEQNRVTINDKIPELGTKVCPNDVVKIDGNAINAVSEDKEDRIYIAYHKPVGITCTTESQVKENIIDAVGHPERIFPIGRLDKPSEGLIFLTSDGDIVNKILRAENAHDKEYVVTVDKAISSAFIQKMSSGVPILDTVTKPCEVSKESRFVFKIILTQGLNRQIRRMAEYLGYRVTKLVRSRIMNVTLEGLAPNQWRDLTTQEMATINAAVAGSTKTASFTGTPKQVKSTSWSREKQKAQTNSKGRSHNESRHSNPNDKTEKRQDKKPNRSSRSGAKRNFYKK